MSTTRVQPVGGIISGPGEQAQMSKRRRAVLQRRASSAYEPIKSDTLKTVSTTVETFTVEEWRVRYSKTLDHIVVVFNESSEKSYTVAFTALDTPHCSTRVTRGRRTSLVAPVSKFDSISAAIGRESSDEVRYELEHSQTGKHEPFRIVTQIREDNMQQDVRWQPVERVATRAVNPKYLPAAVDPERARAHAEKFDFATRVSDGGCTRSLVMAAVNHWVRAVVQSVPHCMLSIMRVATKDGDVYYGFI
ncbi:MAG: hypothetical protein MHM6MM_006628 [Cercozoa sp. M6MM]